MKVITGITYRLGQARRRAAFALTGAWQFARLRRERTRNGLSVAAVCVGRNDDYMPDFAWRVRATAAWNLQHLVDEVIFVEWNPPAGRELLSPSLTREFPGVKAYVVPAAIHSALCENPNLPLLEYHAKNVGIRRSRTDWILATNADAALSGGTVRTLCRELHSPDVAWTAQRVDIPWREGRQQRIGLLDCVHYRRVIPYTTLGTGEFLLASRALWERVRGYDEALVKHRIGCDVRGTAQMLAHGATVRRAGVVLHLAHPTSCTERVQSHHGEWAPMEDLPYQNGPDWGLANCKETQIEERVWQLDW
jgi:hypothetical protein